MHPDTPSDPQLSTLPWNGSSLSYTDEGSGDLTIVAVHGLPGTVRDFRWLAPGLTPFARLIRLELPGFGQSPRARWTGMPLEERAEPLRHVVKALAEGPVVLVGHSAGSAVAAELAISSPELVSALVMLAAPGPTAHYSQAAMAWMGLPLRHRAGRVAMAPLQRRLYRAFGFPRYLSDATLCATTLDAAAQDFARHGDNVARLTLPVLNAWARDDQLIGEARLTALADLVPHARQLVFEEGGHNLQKTCATEVATAIEELVRSL